MKKQVAFLTAVTMIAGMSASAFAEAPTIGEQSAISVANVLNDAIYNFDVPTAATVSFAIDPFQKMDETGSQIYSPYFKMVNRSDVPLSMAVKAKVSSDPAANVVLKKSSNEVNSTTDLTKTDKELYMELVAATLVEGSADSVEGVVAGTADSLLAGGELLETVTGLTDKLATVTNGTDSDNPTAAAIKMVLDATKTTPLLKNVGAMEIVVTDTTSGSETVIGKIISKAVPADATAEKVAASFVGVTCTIKGVEYKASTTPATANDVVLTAETAGVLPDFPTSAKFTLQTPTGISGTAMADVTTPVEFYGHDDAEIPNIVDGAYTKGKIVLGAVDQSMAFALEKGTYSAPYAVDLTTNLPKPTVFMALGINGAAAMRVMGSVNALAEWKASDVKLDLVFNVRGLSTTMYTDAMTAKAADNDIADITGLLPLTTSAAATGATLGGVAATEAGATGSIPYASSMIDGTTKLKVPITLPEGVSVSAVKIANSASAANPTVVIAPASRTVADGVLTITTTTANITNIKSKGAKVSVEFDNNTSVVLTLSL